MSRISSVLVSGLVAALLFGSAVASGCGQEPIADGAASSELDNEGEDVVFEPEDPKADGAGSSVRLAFEGTCAFLRNCSAYSHTRVTFGCDASYTCGDNKLWVAAPRAAHACDETVKICRNGECIRALVVDTSCCGHWEASYGVLAALGLPASANANACTGSGGGTVKIYR